MTMAGATIMRETRSGLSIEFANARSVYNLPVRFRTFTERSRTRRVLSASRQLSLNAARSRPATPAVFRLELGPKPYAQSAIPGGSGARTDARDGGQRAAETSKGATIMSNREAERH